METKVDLRGSAETGSKDANGGVSDRDRALRLAAATLDLIRSGDRSLRVLQLGPSADSLAPLCNHEIALVESENGAEGAEDVDCAVSVDRFSRLSDEERGEHLDALRSKAGIVLVEAPVEEDAALDDAQRYFEQLGDWTTLISEQRFSELPTPAGVPERAVLVSVADESSPGIDTGRLRTETGPVSGPEPDAGAGIAPLAVALALAMERLSAAERHTDALEGQLARREAQVGDLGAKLADLSRLAADERRLRQRAELELEDAKSTRGYRLGLRIFRIRTATRRGLGTAVRAITWPLRWIGRKLRGIARKLLRRNP